MAAAAYRAAARLAPDRPTREDHLLRALECLLAAGDAGQAALLADLLPDFEDSARLRYLRAWLAMIEGRWEEADRGLRAAWDASLREGERALAATVAASLATMNVNQAGRLSEAAEWARRSLEHGAAEVATLGPRAVLPMALAATGRYEEALATVSPGPGEDDLGPGDVDGITGRGVVRLWIGDLEAARTDLDRAVSTAKSLGTFATEVIALTYLSEAEFRIGAWDDAIVHGELAASTASDADQTWMHTLAHANAALPLAWRGRWDAAGQHVDRALEVATLLPHDANLIWAYTARATLAAAFEDHAGVVEATEVVEAAMRGVIEPGIKPWWVLRADALVALGEPGTGRRGPPPSLASCERESPCRPGHTRLAVRVRADARGRRSGGGRADRGRLRVVLAGDRARGSALRPGRELPPRVGGLHVLSHWVRLGALGKQRRAGVLRG
jgi:tetratricopeptide (TPR) repeat protein